MCEVYSKGMRYIGTALFILIFLGVMFSSLFHVSAGMDMTGHSHDCPVMSGQQEVLCSKSVTEHLRAWQASFTTTMTPLVQLVIVAVLLVASIGAILFTPVPRYYRLSVAVVFHELSKKLYRFCVRPWQELFARGVLHPRVYA